MNATSSYLNQPTLSERERAAVDAATEIGAACFFMHARFWDAVYCARRRGLPDSAVTRIGNRYAVPVKVLTP